MQIPHHAIQNVSFNWDDHDKFLPGEHGSQQTGPARQILTLSRSQPGLIWHCSDTSTHSPNRWTGHAWMCTTERQQLCMPVRLYKMTGISNLKGLWRPRLPSAAGMEEGPGKG